MEEEKHKEHKRHIIEEKMKKRKQEHEKTLQLEKELQKKFENTRKTERLYHKMEHRYQSEIMLPSLEEKKNKLKQLREFHQKYELDAVKEHEKLYRQRQLETERAKSQQKGGKPQSKNVDIYDPPLHSTKLSRFLEEESMAIKQQLTARKLQNE